MTFETEARDRRVQISDRFKVLLVKRVSMCIRSLVHILLANVRNRSLAIMLLLLGLRFQCRKVFQQSSSSDSTDSVKLFMLGGIPKLSPLQSTTFSTSVKTMSVRLMIELWSSSPCPNCVLQSLCRYFLLLLLTSFFSLVAVSVSVMISLFESFFQQEHERHQRTRKDMQGHGRKALF